MRKYLFLVSLLFPLLCSCSYFDDYRNRKFMEEQGIVCEGFFAEEQTPIYKEYYKVSCKNGTVAIIDKNEGSRKNWVLASEEKISNEQQEEELVLNAFSSQNIKCDGIEKRKPVDEENKIYKFICNNGNSGKFKYDEQSQLWAYVPLGAFLGFFNNAWESRYTITGIIILIISLLPIVSAAFKCPGSEKWAGALLIWFYIHTLYIIPYMSSLHDGIEGSIARFFAAAGLIILGLGLYTGPLAIIINNMDFADTVEAYWKSLIAQPVIYILGLVVASHWKISLIIAGVIITAAVVIWRIKVAKEARIAREREEEKRRIAQEKADEAARIAKEKADEAAFRAEEREKRNKLIKSTHETDLYYKIGNEKRREYSTDAEGRKHGQEKVYYRNGKLNKVQNWQNGLLHGEAEVYYPDGSIYIKASYENGDLIKQDVSNQRRNKK